MSDPVTMSDGGTVFGIDKSSHPDGLPDDLPKFCLEVIKTQLAAFGVEPACNFEGALKVLARGESEPVEARHKAAQERVLAEINKRRRKL